MDRRQRISILTFLLCVLALSGVYGSENWQYYADSGNGYFWTKDYNAAWLFYEQALERGCDDGVILFRAARSFQYQSLTENPELMSNLYAAAHYFLSRQYPHDTGIAISLKYFDSSTIVDQRFLNKFYRQFGSKVPKVKKSSNLWGNVKEYILQSLQETRQLIGVIVEHGLKTAYLWSKPRVWHLLTTWLMLSIVTGIILPIVVAFAVSLEGRKSYVTAYACLIHWGFLGIHRFYLGRSKSGLIWLLTGGLLGLGIFFDIFLTGAYVRFWNEENKGSRRQSRGFLPFASKTAKKTRNRSKSGGSSEKVGSDNIEDFSMDDFSGTDFSD